MSKRKGMLARAAEEADALEKAIEGTDTEGQTLAGQVCSDEAILSGDDTPCKEKNLTDDIGYEATAKNVAPAEKSGPELLVKYTSGYASEIGYATDGSAGIDLRCHMEGCRGRGTRLVPGVTSFFKTGIAVAIPEGYVGLIVMRSSKSANDGILLANQVAVIDSDFRGEIQLPLTTDRQQGVYVSNGERVAQLIIVPCATVKIRKTENIGNANGNEYLGELEIMTNNKMGIRVVSELPATERGENGFGSTGNM